MPLIETDPVSNGAMRALAAVPDEVAAIEADLALARARVTASVRALGDEVARRRDWRAWVRSNPGLTLAAAAAVGFLAGRALRGAARPDPTRR